MAFVFNRAVYILDADASPAFDPGSQGGQIAAVKGTTIVYFHSTGSS